jgi:SAM-dependent methyltransferase
MSRAMANHGDIVEFWNQQADQFEEDPRANTPDRWIHRIEVAAVTRILRGLPPTLDILDLGCANGHTTFLLNDAFPEHRIIGGDLSRKMVDVARRRLARSGAPESANLRFEVMDMLDLKHEEARFDVVLTIRSLINLPDSASQWKAIGEIARSLRPGGRYIAIENFRHAQERLNAVRKGEGLLPLPYRWHNCWFDENEFRRHCLRFFDLEEFAAITSTYYLVTRVVYSKLCQLEGRSPDYDHPIYEIATRLPPEGDYGPVKLSHWIRARGLSGMWTAGE